MWAVAMYSLASQNAVVGASVIPYSPRTTADAIAAGPYGYCRPVCSSLGSNALGVYRQTDTKLISSAALPGSLSTDRATRAGGSLGKYSP